MYETALMLAFNRAIVTDLKARFAGAPKTGRPVSAFQRAILDWGRDGEGSAIVEAVAGSGKSTTLEMLVDTLDLRDNIEVKTLNGAGHGALYRSLGNVTLEKDKTRKLMRQTLSRKQIEDFGRDVKVLVGVAKAYGIVPADSGFDGLMADSDENWRWLARRFQIAYGDDNAESRYAIRIAREILSESMRLSFDMRIVDFDDQKYLPVVAGWSMQWYDWLFVDEGQDMSPIDLALVQRMYRDITRVVVVGDRRQGIYGFRGAAGDALDRAKAAFDATELPLSICYRCPKSVVSYAKRIVTQIEPFEGADEGIVYSWGRYAARDFEPGDMVMCRNVAPLVSMTYRLIVEDVPARMLGRDIGAGLIRIIDKLKPKGINGKNGLKAKLDDWLGKELAKARESECEDAIAAIEDRYESIAVLLERPELTTVPKVKDAITSLFESDQPGVTLCTVHKAKGLESTRAFVLDPSRMPSKYAREPWQREQEANLQYVAWTRAMAELVFIRSEDMVRADKIALPEAA